MRSASLLLLPALSLTLVACGTPPAGQSAGGPAGTAPAPGGAPQTAEVANTPSATPSPTPSVPTCTDVAAQLSQPEQVGQLFMVGKGATTPVDESFRSVLKETNASSVLLLENTSAGRDGVKRLTDQIRAAAVKPQGIGPLLAADQEGGMVQRLKGEGFESIPSANEQAKLGDAELQQRAKTWGSELRQAGIDYDLAPVADTVPSSVGRANEPVGALRRGYGAEPNQVAPKASAFVKGMAEADVATSVKHFPNLGRVRGNTDLQSGVTDAQTTRTDPALKPFSDAVAAGADSVMVSTAIYSKIDPGKQATFSKVIVTDMIRGDLGFDGVVISDDMGAAKQVASVSPGDRALRFLEAGGDLVINGDPSIQREMYAAVRDKAERDPAFAKRVTESAGRVLALKAQQGAATCATGAD